MEAIQLALEVSARLPNVLEVLTQGGAGLGRSGFGIGGSAMAAYGFQVRSERAHRGLPQGAGRDALCPLNNNGMVLLACLGLPYSWGARLQAPRLVRVKPLSPWPVPPGVAGWPDTARQASSGGAADASEDLLGCLRRGYAQALAQGSAVPNALDNLGAAEGGHACCGMGGGVLRRVDGRLATLLAGAPR